MTLRGGVGLYSDFIGLGSITGNLPTSSPTRLTQTLDDSAEPNGNFFCGFFCGPWHPYTGISANPGLPDSSAFIGTNGSVAPFGIPYPQFPISGHTNRGLTIGADGFAIRQTPTAQIAI